MELWARWAVPKASSIKVRNTRMTPSTRTIVLHTDVDVTEGSQALAEFIDLSLVGLDLLALGILGAALLLGVETQVLKQNDLAIRGLVHSLLGLRANAVLGEDNALAEKLLELGDNRLQAVLGVDLAIRAAQMRHEHNGLGTVLNGILDGGEGTNNTLRVGNVLVLVERDVEVNLFQISGYESLALNWPELTRIKTRLPLRSTSVMGSLLERDIVGW